MNACPFPAREPREHATEPAPEPVPFFQIDFDLACALKALADRGGATAFVRAPDVANSRLRNLRLLGLVDLLDGMKGIESRLTATGVTRLPDALRAIAAGPKGRGA